MYRKDWELCLCTLNFMWIEMVDMMGNSKISQRNWKIVSNQFWIVRLNDWTWNTVKTYLYIRDTYDIGYELENVTKKKMFVHIAITPTGIMVSLELLCSQVDRWKERERKRKKTEYSKQKKYHTNITLFLCVFEPKWNWFGKSARWVFSTWFFHFFLLWFWIAFYWCVCFSRSYFFFFHLSMRIDCA